MEPPRLRELQRAFFEAIAGAPGEAPPAGAAARLAGAVRGGVRLAAERRIGIYREMYAARLLDVLREDHPRVAEILGERRFAALARAYLARHPSCHPSIRWVSRELPAFVASLPPRRGIPPFLADLARLEQARLEVFDAADARPLRIEELRAMPAPQWPGLSLRLIPACRVLRLAWPVHEIWAAGGDRARRGGWQPRPTALRVWRDGFAVYQASVETAEEAVLGRLEAGATFAEVCAVLAGALPAADAPHRAGALLLRWVEDGILELADGLDAAPSRSPAARQRSRRSLRSASR